MRREGTAVCVTGGSGFIASWLIKLLLHRGYTVKATVRDPNDQKKTDHLRALDGAGERLHLFKADLMEEGSFDAAVDGCEGVFHTASPISLSPKDPQAELIEPAVKGTLNVLRSCTKVPSVRRVVITSSMASMIMNGMPLTPDVLVDETWLSDPAFCKENKLWYMLSKTLAEDAAWKLAKDNGIDMVAVHPGWVFGPILQASTLNFTLEWTRNFIDGSQKPPHNLHGFVDVRDVAHAHIQAFEVPSASGRYCLVESVAYWSEILKIAHEHFPTLSLAETEEDKASVPRYEVSKEKAKTLGIEFTPVEVTVIATVEGLKEKGFLTI